MLNIKLKYSHSTLRFDNDADEYNLVRPAGAQLENQYCVTAFDKEITIIVMLRLILVLEQSPDKAF